MSIDAIAHAMLRYTPQVALAERHTVLLDVSASLRVFGGVLALARQVRRSLDVLGQAGGVGMAPTAYGAWLLAQAPTGPRRVLAMRRLPALLDRLPCRLLPEAEPHAAWLAEIGCRSLGGLRRLPRDGLQRRVGPALMKRLDAAYGLAPTVLRWIEPPARFDRTLELPERIDHAEAAWHALARLLEPLCGWLTARHRAASAFTVYLHHERGRHARPPTALPLRLAEPAAQPEHLVRLLRERLARLELPAPVIAVQLTHCETAPLPGDSAPLFIEPGGQPADHRRLIELLTSRLGPGRLLQPGHVADHRPEHANTWTPVEEGSSGVRAGGQAWGPSPPPPGRPKAGGAPSGGSAARASGQAWGPPTFYPQRPFWLLPEPQPLAEANDRPIHGTPLRLIHGPERIEAGWWAGALTARDYYVAEDARHVRFWVYCERGVEPARWFLHGLFA